MVSRPFPTPLPIYLPQVDLPAMLAWVRDLARHPDSHGTALGTPLGANPAALLRLREGTAARSNLAR